MSNVTQLTVARALSHPGVIALEKANQAPGNILFPVVERPLAVLSALEGVAPLGVESHKAIVRKLGGKPACIGVVGSNFGVLQNKSVLPGVEKELLDRIPADQWKGVVIKDSMSYGGAWTQRTYRFPHFTTPIETREGFKTGLCFQVCFRNAYDGSASVFLGGSVVDLICTNGLAVTSWTENVKRRHSSQVARFPWDSVITMAISRYQAEVMEFQRLANAAVPQDDKVLTFLKDNFSERRAEQLFEQYRVERNVRGRNAFALVSALTFYSSHNSGTFAVRSTGNDNEAATLARRDAEVAAVLASKRWADFLAAA